MKLSLVFVLASSLAASLATPAVSAAQVGRVESSAQLDRPEIVSNGTGQVVVRADVAHLRFTVVTRALTPAEAGRMNVARMNPLVLAIRRQGLADSAVRTVGYSVARDADQEMTPTGMRAKPDSAIRYTARNTVRVTITAMDRLGPMIDTALAAGASVVESLEWATSQQRTHRIAALGLAVSSAREEAEAMARAAGGSLGAVIEISEGLSFNQDIMLRAANRIGAEQLITSTLIMPQDLTINAYARVRWQFVPGRR